MTAYSVPQGRSVTMSVEWLQYPGGPSSTVTGVTIEVAPTSGGASPVGPTSSGVTNPATGINLYTWQVPVAQAVGDYLVIWRGTDGDGDQVQATDTLTVTAAPASVTALITVADAKAQLNIPASDTSQDVELAGYIDAVTDVIEYIVGPVVPRQVVELHDGGGESVALRRPPVLAVTAVAEQGVAVASDAWTLSSAGILYRTAGTWSRRRGGLSVTYQAGRASVPASIRQAAKELLALHWRSQQGGNYSPFDTGGDAGDGQVILGFFVPGKVMQLLRPHEQIGGFA